jgi:hypothetical protein
MVAPVAAQAEQPSSAMVACGIGGTITYTPDSLKAPNHKLQRVTLSFVSSFGVSDSDPTVARLLDVTAVVGQNAPGDVEIGPEGHSVTVAAGQVPPPAVTYVDLRANKGAVYTLTVTCQEEGAAFTKGYDAISTATIRIAVG